MPKLADIFYADGKLTTNEWRELTNLLDEEG